MSPQPRALGPQRAADWLAEYKYCDLQLVFSLTHNLSPYNGSIYSDTILADVSHTEERIQPRRWCRHSCH